MAGHDFMDYALGCLLVQVLSFGLLIGLVESHPLPPAQLSAVMEGVFLLSVLMVVGIGLLALLYGIHESLNGETPADRAGIRVEGDNKWLTIIQNASHAATERAPEQGQRARNQQV